MHCSNHNSLLIGCLIFTHILVIERRNKAPNIMLTKLRPCRFYGVFNTTNFSLSFVYFSTSFLLAILITLVLSSKQHRIGFNSVQHLNSCFFLTLYKNRVKIYRHSLSGTNYVRFPDSHCNVEVQQMNESLIPRWEYQRFAWLPAETSDVLHF